MSASPLPLDPALLAQMADLELAARLVVEGARLGLHRSPFTGGGAEFQQMRPYLPGDDLKHLDWKRYARTDRLFTRVYREATEWPVMLALDTSRSMAFADGRGVAKLHAGRLLAAALAYLLLQQGEAVGLVTQEAEGASLPARSDRRHLVRLLGTLVRLDAAGGTDLAGGLRRAAARLGRRGCIVLISDLYGSDDWDVALREARRAGHEVVIFHVFTPDERVLPAGDDSEFVDLESGERLVTDVSKVRERYAEQFSGFLAGQRAAAHAEGIVYVEADTSRGLETLVREFAQQRVSRAGVRW